MKDSWAAKGVGAYLGMVVGGRRGGSKKWGRQRGEFGILLQGGETLCSPGGGNVKLLKRAPK